MFWSALLGIVVTMFLALIRGMKGPTVYDRVLAVNNMGTNAVLLIAVAGFAMGIHDPQGSELQASRPEFLDLALVYALVNFAGTIAVLKYIRFGSLSNDHKRVKR
jgi:multicomponent Na+:H+ antiporter subunit F